MHAVISTSALPLFLGALLSDWAYSRSFQTQWINFSSWLIAGALVLTGLALLGALVGGPRRRGGWVHLLLLLATFVLGFINALVHARDAAATMPTGLVLSALVLVLAAVAAGMGLAGWRRRAIA
ncbi:MULTISPECIES: hypothetical protein [Hydrogenophaga]|uniref:Putative membrane protein n=1 Tax=Hydrogenophaga intermedia TaxID=65786 RepID=A0A1L1PDL3_HYDIT|nr:MULTISPECIES: hypothetical protein [Hydrogenophaga]CDN88108.1 putative membrane protein [Hydrogenophaga intermedia]